MRDVCFTLLRKLATPALWTGMVLILLASAPAAARADVILGNLGSGNGGSPTISTTEFIGASFTMGSQAYALSDVQITLNGTVSSGTTFELESDASGNPSGTALFTFTNPTFSGTNLTTYKFPAGSPFTLAANTTYWLVGLTTSGSSGWVVSSPSTNPSGVATFNQYKETTNSGSSWSPLGSTPVLELDGTPMTGVPEPSSFALLGAASAVLSLGGWYRRRRSASASKQ